MALGGLGALINTVVTTLVKPITGAIIANKVEEVKKEVVQVTKPPYPETLEGIDTTKFPKADAYITYANGGKRKIVDAINYNGALYDPKTLEILADYHGPDGTFDKDRFDSKWDQKTQTAYFVEKKKPTRKSGGGGGGGYHRPPKPPVRPSKISFNEPFPVFASKLKTLYRYGYQFGIDQINLKCVEYAKESVFVSSHIQISGDYIMLEAIYEGDIEFSVLDGEKEIPILPIDTYKVENEKLFMGKNTRFPIDTTYPITISQDYCKTNLTLNVLNNATYWTNHTYSISYIPITEGIHIPIENFVRIKAILRSESSCIKKLNIRCYTENQDKVRL